MPQFQEDFSGLTAGQDLSVLANWTDNFSQAGWEIVASADVSSPGGISVAYDPGGAGGAGLEVYTWLAPGNVDLNVGDLEVLCQFEILDANLGASAPVTDTYPFAVLTDGLSGDTGGYSAMMRASDGQFFAGEFNSSGAGAGLTAASPAVPAVPNLTDNGKWWMRGHATLAGTHEFRIWRDGDAEPASYQANDVDTSITSGYVGLSIVNRAARPVWHFISAGTEGDSAPSPSTGATTKKIYSRYYRQLLAS